MHAEPTTLDRQHSSSIGIFVSSPIMLSPLSSHPKQRADLVAKYFDDVSHPMAIELQNSRPSQKVTIFTYPMEVQTG